MNADHENGSGVTVGGMVGAEVHKCQDRAVMCWSFPKTPQKTPKNPLFLASQRGMDDPKVMGRC